MKKIDAHVHIMDEIPEEATVAYFKELMERKGYEGVGMMSLVIGGDRGFDPESNRRALKILKELPASFAFAALDHRRDFIEQTKEYLAAGFSGIKILEGKPSVWKYYGYGLDHPRFEEFFTYAEEEQIPLLIHNNDPAIHWQREKLDERAIRKGWYYDETYPKKEAFDEVLEEVLRKHPKLKVALAHMGFYADRLTRAAELMEQCPNLMLDITPALPIYADLSAHREEAYAFFRTYGDRLFFGTDADNEQAGTKRAYNDKKTAIISAFLSETEPCTVEGMDIHPIGLSEEALEKIYYHNILRFIGRE